MGEKPKLFNIFLNLGFEFGKVLGASRSFHLVMVIEQNVRNVQVMVALLVVSLKCGGQSGLSLFAEMNFTVSVSFGIFLIPTRFLTCQLEKTPGDLR